MSYLSKEQVRTIINNAPQGTSPAGIVASLRSKGHQLEGYEDTIKNTLVSEQPEEKGLGGKLLDRGRSIVSDFTPNQERTAYQKVSDALGGKMIRTAGQAVGAVGDVVGTAISAGAKKLYDIAYTPEDKERIKQNIANVLDTQAGQAGLNAIKGGVEMYQKFKEENPNVAKDLEAVVNVASILPAGKVLGVGGKIVGSATKETRKSVAKTILSSAEKNVSEALAPTTKEAKYLTEKITPEFMKQGITGSRETILTKAKEGVERFGKEIETYISSGKLKGNVEKRKVTSVIDEFERSGMSESGVVIDSEKVELANKMRDIVSKFADDIPAEEAKSVLRVLGKMTDRKKGFTTGGEKLAAQLEKDIYGSIAGELAKANPSLDKLNKSFNFYKNLLDVTSETISRTKPQSGMFRKAAATLFAGQGQGVLDTAIKYVGSKLFLDFVSGPFYKTVSSKIKTNLAKAIYSGDIKKADTIINAVKSDVTGTAKTILDKSKKLRPGMTINYSKDSPELIREGMRKTMDELRQYEASGNTKKAEVMRKQYQRFEQALDNALRKKGNGEIRPTTTLVSKETPLIQEARKGEVLYHGTTEGAITGNLKAGNSGVMWMAENPDIAKSYANTNRGKVLEFGGKDKLKILDITKREPLRNEALDNLQFRNIEKYIQEARKGGYDAIRLRDRGQGISHNSIAVLPEGLDKIKNTSQISGYPLNGRISLADTNKKGVNQLNDSTYSNKIKSQPLQKGKKVKTFVKRKN